MVGRAKQLLKDDLDSYMTAWLAYRESSVLRMGGRRDESHNALERFVQSTVSPGHGGRCEANPRYNAQRGNLIVSFTENLIQDGKLDEAKSELDKWSPLHPTARSALERITARARDITLGKILKCQGLFGEALVFLERILEDSRVDDFFEGTGWYRVLLSNVADLYCESGRPQDAEEILLQELKPMMENGTQDISTGKRLRLSLVETFLERNMFDAAEEALLLLKNANEGIKKRDHVTDLTMFRVWIGLARVFHKQSRWDMALSYWSQALTATERLKMSRGYNAGIVQYSIAHALHVTGEKTQSHNALREAKICLASEQCMFWLAGFNSHWRDYVVSVMENECRGNCDVQESITAQSGGLRST